MSRAGARLPSPGWAPDPGPAPVSLFASAPPVPMNMASFYYWLNSYRVTLVCAGCGGDVYAICGGCMTARCLACDRDPVLHPHVFVGPLTASRPRVMDVSDEGTRTV